MALNQKNVRHKQLNSVKYKNIKEKKGAKNKLMGIF